MVVKRRIFLSMCLLPLMASCSSGPFVKAALDDEVRRLCAIDGGITVYETVMVDASEPLQIVTREYAKADDKFYYDWDVKTLPGGRLELGQPDITRSHLRLYRVQDKKLLGESIRYTRRGGDALGFVHPSHFSCPDETGPQTLKKKVFLQN